LLKRVRKLIQSLIPSDGLSRKVATDIFVSFLIAVTLWFLVTINRDHSSSFQFPIRIQNLPQNVKFTQELTKEIEVKVNGFGVDLLVEHLRFRKDTVYLNYLPGSSYLLTQQFRGIIRQKVPRPNSIRITDIQPDTLPIDFELLTQKRVPLFSRITPRLDPNYQLESLKILRPDSVSIAGPESAIDTIEAWYTTASELKVEKKFRRYVVALEKQADLSISPDKAIVEVESREYTQKRIEINLVVEHEPDFQRLTFSHTQVRVDCLVPLELYNQLNSSYTLRIPFESLDQNIPYFIPEIESVLPEFARIVTRSPLQINYSILDLSSSS
jgi:hypothetical protein